MKPVTFMLEGHCLGLLKVVNYLTNLRSNTLAKDLARRLIWAPRDVDHYYVLVFTSCLLYKNPLWKPEKLF